MLTWLVLPAAGLRKLDLVWSGITDATLRAISSNLPHLTALYLPTADRPRQVIGRGITVQGICECKAALKELRSLWVKPFDGMTSCPRGDEELEHSYSWVEEHEGQEGNSK